MKHCLLSLIALAAVAGCSAGADNPVVIIKTSKGTIKVELFEKEAPLTVKNFLTYVDKKHYDGCIFHRVIEDFMCQGGGFKKGFGSIKDERDLKKYRLESDKPIKNESSNGLSNKRGTLAMARTNQPDSATDQFFINNKDNAFLDKAKARDGVGYAVFGKVIEGLDVVDKIKKVKTKEILDGAMGDVPVEEVVIESITREKKK